MVIVGIESCTGSCVNMLLVGSSSPFRGWSSVSDGVFGTADVGDAVIVVVNTDIVGSGKGIWFD